MRKGLLAGETRERQYFVYRENIGCQYPYYILNTAVRGSDIFRFYAGIWIIPYCFLSFFLFFLSGGFFSYSDSFTCEIPWMPRCNDCKRKRRNDRRNSRTRYCSQLDNRGASRGLLRGYIEEQRSSEFFPELVTAKNGLTPKTRRYREIPGNGPQDNARNLDSTMAHVESWQMTLPPLHS